MFTKDFIKDKINDGTIYFKGCPNAQSVKVCIRGTDENLLIPQSRLEQVDGEVDIDAATDFLYGTFCDLEKKEHCSAASSIYRALHCNLAS